MTDLIAAITAFDVRAAERALDAGADPLAPGPDGGTPLELAVECGSPRMVTTLLTGETLQRLAPEQRGRLLDLARHWYEREVAALGPYEWVADEDYDTVQQVTLDGRAVRAGHGAVLTLLEDVFGVRTPFDELVARAVRQPVEGHTDFVAVCELLSHRQDPEASASLMALHRHPDPAGRRILAEILSYQAVSEEVQEPSVMVAWAREETDAEVLSQVLFVCSMTLHPELGALGIHHAGHPAPAVRCQVPDLLDTGTADAVSAMLALARDSSWTVRRATAFRLLPERAPEFWEALSVLLHDPVPVVRLAAVWALGQSKDPRPEIGDLLWSLLEDEDREVREASGEGLALRDDERAAEAYRLLGPYYESDGGGNPRLARLRRWVQDREQAPG
ncbi:HEAT repeat domain-containing protein [Kitasatospora sp. NPDC096147]|uniref:HEAT repeat domain-containing protein n=1 Tax=Kitasatospora sp. NPDC096147 TaxID=3364093 RepID=UPI00383074D6